MHTQTLIGDYTSKRILEGAIELYSSGLSLLEVFQDYIDEIGFAISYDFSKHVNKPMEARYKLYKLLNDDFNIPKQDGGKKKLSLEFSLYWWNNFQKEQKKFIDATRKALGDNNKIFQEISENIGQLLRWQTTANYNTIPFWDREIVNIPFLCDSVTINRLYPDIRTNITQLHIYNAEKLKRNLYGILDADMISKEVEKMSAEGKGITFEAHGANLATDYYQYYSRTLYTTEILQEIIKHYDALYPIIQFAYEYNPCDPQHNMQITSTMIHEVLTESNQKQQVDYFHNLFKEKVKELKSYDILSSATQ